jgi:flagellar basal-body rod protein FlgF
VLRGLYTAAAGMEAAAMWEQVVARNLANVDTPGYQPLQAGVGEFAPQLVSALGIQGVGPVRLASATPLGSLGGGDVIVATPGDAQPAPLQAVANPLAAGLSGPGYFVVRTAQGLRYTRDGDFTVNAQGQLATRAGDPVLDTAGQPIAIQPGARLADGGRVLVGGQAVARLQVVQAAAPLALVPVGGSLFADTGAAGLTPLPNPALRAGFLALPPDDSARQLVDLVAAEQAYTSAQRALMTSDEALNLAVTEVGRT